jgi:catechol 2,3-dioxygenase-like lactoylglutathione lyase family enzyme
MDLEYKNIISFVWSRDIEESAHFYCHILDFKKVYESEGWVELSIPGLHTGYLALNLWTRQDEFEKNRFITIGVDNLDAFRSHLEKHDVKIEKIIREFYEDRIRMFKFFDPDGNIITAAEVK